MKYGEKLLARFMSMAKQKLAKANSNILLSTEHFDKIRAILLTPVPQPTLTSQGAQQGPTEPVAGTAGAPERMPPQRDPEKPEAPGMLSKFMSMVKNAGLIMFGGAAIVGGAKTETTSETSPRLKQIITQAEGTTDSAAKARGFESAYDVPYGYDKYLAPHKPLSTMTLDEVDAFQIKLINATKGEVPGAKPTEGTSAVGKYQFIRPTLRDLTKDLPGSTIFSPQLQERLGNKLIAKRIKQGGGDTKKTILALSQEFASLPMDESGRSFYNQPVGVSYNDLSQAVNQNFAVDRIIKKYQAVMEKNKKGSDINSQGDPESDSPTAQIVVVPINSGNENAGGSSPPASTKSTMSGTKDKAGSLLLRLGLNAQ